MKAAGSVLGWPSESKMQPGGTDLPLLYAIVTLPPAMAQVDRSIKMGGADGRGMAMAMGFADNRRSRPPHGATNLPAPWVLTNITATKPLRGEVGGSMGR